MKHTNTKTRIVESSASEGRIIIKEKTSFVQFGYVRSKWDLDCVSLTPDELVKICQSHGIVVPAPSTEGADVS